MGCARYRASLATKLKRSHFGLSSDELAADVSHSAIVLGGGYVYERLCSRSASASLPLLLPLLTVRWSLLARLGYFYPL